MIVAPERSILPCLSVGGASGPAGQDSVISSAAPHRRRASRALRAVRGCRRFRPAETPDQSRPLASSAGDVFILALDELIENDQLDRHDRRTIRISAARP
jgi:hypothetical protein